MSTPAVQAKKSRTVESLKRGKPAVVGAEVLEKNTVPIVVVATAKVK